MITTERLTVRRVRESDWKAIRDIWIDAAKSQYAQYDRPSETDDESVRKRIRKWASCGGSTEHMFYAVCLRETVIGYAVLNLREKGYEIGYCFHSAYHGKGYARESISAILNTLAGAGIRDFSAGTALKNTPSVRLLSALGFRMTGTEKVSFYRDEQGNDIVFDGGIFELHVEQDRV